MRKKGREEGGFVGGSKGDELGDGVDFVLPFSDIPPGRVFSSVFLFVFSFFLLHLWRKDDTTNPWEQQELQGSGKTQQKVLFWQLIDYHILVCMKKRKFFDSSSKKKFGGEKASHFPSRQITPPTTPKTNLLSPLPTSQKDGGPK